MSILRETLAVYTAIASVLSILFCGIGLYYNIKTDRLRKRRQRREEQGHE